MAWLCGRAEGLSQGARTRLLNKEYLERTLQFIIIARFIPIIRTFAPFVAGIGRMTYARFLLYNVVGGILWIAAFVYAGYFFGNIPFVKQNFTLVILAIIFISILPGVIEYLRHRSQRKESRESEEFKLTTL